MTLVVHPQMKALYNAPSGPGFWRGTLRVREADLMATDGQPSPVAAWMEAAVARVRVLLAASEAGEDVTLLPEFERWLGPTAAAVFRNNHYEESSHAV